MRGPDFPTCQLRHAKLSGVSTKDRVGWLYPRNSILKRLVDKILLDLSQKGIERKIHEKYFGRSLECDSNPFLPVGFDIVLALFKILGIGCGVSIIFTIFEAIVINCQRATESPSSISIEPACTSFE